MDHGRHTTDEDRYWEPSKRRLSPAAETAWGAGFCYELNRRRLEAEGYVLRGEGGADGTGGSDGGTPAPDASPTS